MGGHGGLNILPQKSWNVYGAKQRARVERDEAKAREDAEEAARRVLESARDERYEALSRRHVRDETLATTTTTSGQQHVNLFAAEERAAVFGAEVQRQKRRTRGRDAAEDARGDRFGVGRGAVAPWYARTSGGGGDTAVVDDDDDVVVESLPRRARRRREEEEALRLKGRRGEGRRAREAKEEEEEDAAVRLREKTREKSSSTKESSRRRKRRRRDDGGKRNAAKDDLDALRRERLEREAKEADRVKFLARSSR